MRNSMCVFALLAATTVASAGVAFVSGNGSDANSCNATFPCRTFQAAVPRAGIGGSVVALDSSDFTLGSTLNLGFPITIDGGAHGAFASGPFGGAAINITLPSSYYSAIVIRNLTIVPQITAGSGAIGAVLSASPLKLENVAITLAYSQNSNFGISVLLDQYSSVSIQNVSIFTGTNYQSGTVDQDCIDIFPANSGQTTPFNVIADHVTTDGCFNGLLIEDGNATIKNSSFNGAVNGVGLIAVTTSPSWLIDHTELVNNSSTGANAGGGGTLRLSNSVVSGNHTGISIGAGATGISFRNNTFAGNGADGALSLSTSLK